MSALTRRRRLWAGTEDAVSQYIRRLAQRLSPDDASWQQDLVQEGLLGAWRATCDPVGHNGTRRPLSARRARMCRAARHAMARAVARELAQRGVTVHAGPSHLWVTR